MRVGPHHHRCADCQTKTECCGQLKDNFDGSPEIICVEFHLAGGETNPDFICEGCAWKREDAEARERDMDARLKADLL